MSIPDSVKEIQGRVVLNAARLNALRATALLDASPDEQFDRLTKITSMLLKVNRVFVTLIDADRHFFLSMHGVPNVQPADRYADPVCSFCQQVVVSDKLLVISDVNSDELTCQQDSQNAFGIVAYMGTPLKTPDHERIGALCVISNEPRVWNGDEKQILVEMGELVMKEIALRYHFNEHVRAERDIEKHIDKLEKTNLELAQKNIDLEKANAAKGDFLATISHEIRTPMNGVIGFTSLLMETKLDYLQHEYANTIRASGEALLDIINDVLDFSAIESGNVVLDKHPFSIYQCVAEALDVIALRASQKGLELGYIVDTSIPEMLIGDSGRIRQILVNLMGNAVKFTDSGEITTEVFLDARDPEVNGSATLHIIVKDTGIGIAQEKLEEIFQSFSQVDSSTSRQYGGTGLGLSISKALCTLMKGEIWAESEEGVGSTFHLSIKLELSKDHVERTVRVPTFLKNRKLLVSRVSEINQKLLRQLCTSASIACDFVDTNWVIDSKELSGYDAFLFDPDMSDMSLVLLKKTMQAWRGKVPVIIIQKLGLHQHQVGEEIAAILNKPIKKNIFYGVLEDCIRNNPNRVAVPANVHRSGNDASHDVRILVAEDNPINQKLILRFLDVLGFKGVLVSTGKAVLEALNQQKFDVVLMDIHMPEMDGVEATEAIRSLSDSNKGIYILGITAGIKNETRERSMVAGMNDFLSKPISIEDLNAALHKAIATL